MCVKYSFLFISIAWSSSFIKLAIRISSPIFIWSGIHCLGCFAFHFLEYLAHILTIIQELVTVFGSVQRVVILCDHVLQAVVQSRTRLYKTSSLETAFHQANLSRQREAKTRIQQRDWLKLGW